MAISTVAYNCHGNNKKLTATTKSSRQQQKAHGKSKKLTAKTKSSRQKQKPHGKNKKLTAKAKSSRRKKGHGKNKKITTKTKCSRQKLTCDQALFPFRSVKHAGGKGETKNQGGKRLGDETSASEQKGVMQWTGIKLGARSKWLPPWVSSVILIIY